MQVKLTKDFFDPGGTLRRKTDRPEGTYVPGEFKDRLPKGSVVLGKIEPRAEEPVVVTKTLKDAGEDDRADLLDPATIEKVKERDRLQTLSVNGTISAGDKHKLKKLNEELAAKNLNPVKE
jgi:hypothetical protein